MRNPQRGAKNLSLNLSFYVLSAICDVRCMRISSRVRKRNTRAVKDSRSELKRECSKVRMLFDEGESLVVAKSDRSSVGELSEFVRTPHTSGAHATGAFRSPRRGKLNGGRSMLPREPLVALAADSHVLHQS